MRVADLIELLSSLPSDAVVTHVDGENGRTPITSVRMERDYYLPIDVVEIN